MSKHSRILPVGLWLLGALVFLLFRTEAEADDQVSRDSFFLTQVEKEMVKNELTLMAAFLEEVPSDPLNLGAALYLYNRGPLLPREHRTAVLEAMLATLSPDEGHNELAELYFWLSRMYGRQSISTRQDRKGDSGWC